MGSARFVNVDRETPLLLPPDLRDWVRGDDLAHFLLDALKEVDASVAQVNQTGSGSLQYPPLMMLGTLIYCYANGIFSSRKIEAATYNHVSVRFITGNTHPDHDTICRFRRENGELIRQAFQQVLEVGALCELGRVGTVCLDGTKILADASKRRSLTRQQLVEMERRVQGEINSLLEEAEKADQQDQPDGTNLPPELVCQKQRQAKLAEARRRLQELTAQKAEEREKERQVIKAEKFGRLPEPLPKIPPANATINLTDPESKIMPMPKGGYAQAYNAQLAISGEKQGGLILATSICTDTHDRLQLEPMIGQLPKSILTERESPLEIVVDTGYDNVVQIRRCEKNHPVKIYCPTQRKKKGEPTDINLKPAHSKSVQKARRYRSTITKRAATARGKSLMKLRSRTVEPTFGNIKRTMGWSRTLLRGIQKVDLEFRLVALAFNCRRLSSRFGQSASEN